VAERADEQMRAAAALFDTKGRVKKKYRTAGVET